MGSDARSRYSQMVIKNSFVELLKKKPINKITVKEVSDMAGIHRATFSSIISMFMICWTK